MYFTRNGWRKVSGQLYIYQIIVAFCLTCNAFIRKSNLMRTNRQYAAVIKAIPQATLLLTKGMLTQSVVILVIEGSSILDRKCYSKLLRTILTAMCFFCPLKRKHILQEFTDDAIIKKKQLGIHFSEWDLPVMISHIKDLTEI